MRALLYLTRRSFINSMKKALRKPVSLILIIMGALYTVFVLVTLAQVVKSVEFGSVKGLLAIVTVWTLYAFLGNFISYSSKKGVIFRPAHAHFVFPAPISPKTILIHGAWMNYLLSIAMGLVFFIGGVTVFQVSAWKMVLFFLTGCVLELLLEGSLMVYLYTNDKVPASAMKWVGRVIKAFLVGIALFIVFYFRKYGLSIDSAFAFIDWPGLQMIPIVGWNIAVYHLILLGPTYLNVVCTLLYLLSVAVIFVLAYRMECEGGYYEDAAKFADRLCRDETAEEKRRDGHGSGEKREGNTAVWTIIIRPPGQRLFFTDNFWNTRRKSILFSLK
ncbi:MAG: putative ABC exporter domain-containing protein [Muricomes sp.]